MSKDKTRNKGVVKVSQRSTKKGKKAAALRSLGALALAVALIAGAIEYFSNREPWGLPAIPQNPRPATLSPVFFGGMAAKAYQIAREVPQLLERMPCYCGCYVNPGHRNNLDCYIDRHGAG